MGFFKERGEGVCPRDRGEWGLVRLLGGHITLGKGIDGISIEQETINNPTHNASTQTPFQTELFYSYNISLL